MTAPQIRFDDGATYERYMGVWSRSVGEAFLDWLAPAPGWRWLDVGCGNGAFTELLVTRSSPASVDGVDPSAAQLDHARAQPLLADVSWHQADAMALPFGDATFDAAVMPLVLFFVPEPRRGVAEMRRVVKAGGVVAAYAWDMPGGGFPYHALHEEMRALGMQVAAPPSPEASRIEVMRELWMAAGLQAVETRPITAERRFTDFDDYWQTVLGAPSVGPKLAALTAGGRDALRRRMREVLPTDATGRIICRARANAVKGGVAAAGSRRA